MYIVGMRIDKRIVQKVRKKINDFIESFTTLYVTYYWIYCEWYGGVTILAMKRLYLAIYYKLFFNKRK